MSHTTKAAHYRLARTVRRGDPPPDLHPPPPRRTPPGRVPTPMGVRMVRAATPIANDEWDVLEAIEAWVRNHAELIGLLTHFGIAPAPQGTLAPYATIADIGETFDHHTEPGRIARRRIQISLFAPSAKQIKALDHAFTKGAAKLDFAAIPVGQGDLIQVIPDGRVIDLTLPETDAAGKRIRMKTLDYVVLTQHPE
jgi:hypothetical protein